MWTLRLRGFKGKSATVQVSPDTTMQDFCDLTMQQLAIKGANLHLYFRYGFPRVVVEYAPTDKVQDKFANNSTIVVDTKAPSAEPRQAVAPPAAPKRAAPAAKAKAKAKEPARSGGVHTLSGGSSQRATAASKRKDRGAGVRLGESFDEESVVVEPAAESPSARKYRRTRAVQLTSKDDIAEKLVQAVSGSSKDRVGKFFRAATKSAVEHQYEMTLANARLNAALANKFEIVEVPKTSGTTGGGPGEVDIRVKFKETVRKWKEETYTLLQPVELQAVLKYVLISGGETGREMLKPFNMAQVSPRVFWNIARLYNGDVAAGLAELVPDEDWSFLDTRTRVKSKKAMEAQANEEVYKRWKKNGTASGAPAPSAVPGLAVDAPRAARAARSAQSPLALEVISVDTDDDADEEQKAEATEQQQMQAAMAYAEQSDKRSLREAMARAAASRVDARARAEAVTSAFRESGRGAGRETVSASGLATNDPEETESEDEGEAGEEEGEDIEKTTTIYCDSCNKARILSLAEAETAGAAGTTGDQWTCARLASINREGSCEAPDDELVQMAGEQLARVLQLQAKIRTRQELANTTMATAPRQLAHPLDSNYTEIKTKLEELIEEARLDEVNDAMAEIIGGNGKLLGILELQKLGTPADLVETPADLIVSALASRKKTVSMETVVDWQDQAREKITSCPWMGEWRTI